MKGEKKYKLKEGFSVQRIKELTGRAEIDKFLIPMEILLPDFPKVILKEEGSTLAKHGNLIYPENILRVFDQDSSRVKISGDEDVLLRLFNVEGKLLALARNVPEKNGIHPFLVIDAEEKRS